MRLYVSDLDGTLFPSIYGLSQEGKTRLARLIDGGLPFTFATSRALPSAIDAIGRPSIRSGRIANNGTVVINKTGEVIHQVTLPWKNILGISERLRRMALPIIWALDAQTGYERRCWLPNGPHHLDPYMESRKHDPTVVRMRSFDDLPRNRFCLNISTVGPGDLLRDLKKQFHSEYLTIQVAPDPYQIGVYTMTVQGRTDKGEALLVLCAEEGIPPENVTVFGDSLSDMPLFRVAGRRVAVENAVEELKEQADEIIGQPVLLSVLDWLEEHTRSGAGKGSVEV